MKFRASPGLLITFFALISLSALGIAIVSLSPFRIRSVEITTDCDSLRTEFLTVLLESIYAIDSLNLRVSKIQDVLSDLPQADEILVKKSWFGHIHIDMVAKKPVLKISNQNGAVCINSEGMPFYWLPEHDPLPKFTVPADISIDQLINPDDHIAEFYDFALFLYQTPLQSLRTFSHLTAINSNQLIITEPFSHNRLLISRRYSEMSSVAYSKLDKWLSHNSLSDKPLEFDLRFPGMLVMRSAKKDQEHV